MKSAEWFAERFGLGGPASLEGPVDRGLQGQVWRLSCGGQAYAVKEALTPLDHEQVVAAYALQQRAEAAGVLAPRQLLTTAGDPAATSTARRCGSSTGWSWPPPDRDLDAVGLGRCLAALHRAGGPTTAEVDRWFAEPVGEDHWRGAGGRAQPGRGPVRGAADRGAVTSWWPARRSWSRRGTVMSATAISGPTTSGRRPRTAGGDRLGQLRTGFRCWRAGHGAGGVRQHTGSGRRSLRRLPRTRGDRPDDRVRATSPCRSPSSTIWSSWPPGSGWRPPVSSPAVGLPVRVTEFTDDPLPAGRRVPAARRDRD